MWCLEWGISLILLLLLTGWYLMISHLLDSRWDDSLKSIYDSTRSIAIRSGHTITFCMHRYLAKVMQTILPLTGSTLMSLRQTMRKLQSWWSIMLPEMPASFSSITSYQTTTTAVLSWPLNWTWKILNCLILGLQWFNQSSSQHWATCPQVRIMNQNSAQLAILFADAYSYLIECLTISFSWFRQ